MTNGSHNDLRRALDLVYGRGTGWIEQATELRNILGRNQNSVTDKDPFDVETWTMLRGLLEAYDAYVRCRTGFIEAAKARIGP